MDEEATIMARQGIELAFNGETKVVRQDGEEVVWNGQELGEIVTRGNVVMAGYYKDPVTTAAAIRDGWFHTGDSAVTHPDGYIEIRDRAKDLIISGGEIISSTEVEGILYQHPDVLETAVIAIPDEKWGEVPKAIIVLKPEAKATEAEIIEFCRLMMAHFKAPKAVEFVDSLPKTATGKLQKYRLREMHWSGPKKVNYLFYKRAVKGDDQMQTTTEIIVQEVDLDYLGHVNYNKYIAYLEQGVGDWYDGVGDLMLILRKIKSAPY